MILSDLNTSHVEVYQGVSMGVQITQENLNTSHVEVYPLRSASHGFHIFVFKYISC